MLRSSSLAGFDQTALEDGQLLSAIAQLPQALDPNLACIWYRLPKPVLHKAQQLVHLLLELRSPQSGWPTRLAYNADNLAPYVTEEAYDLLEALRQLAISRQGGLRVAPAEPLHLVDWQLRQMDLGLLRSQLLWEIASSGHGIMQLLEGVAARVDGRPAQVRLVVGLRTPDHRVDLNSSPGGQTLAEQTSLQLESDTLISPAQNPRAQTVEDLLSSLHRLLQRNAILRPFLNRQAVQLLRPGQPWQQTFLQITLRLASISAGSGLPNLSAEPPVPERESPFIFPDLSSDLDQFLLGDGIDTDTARADAGTDAVQAEDLTILTADDLALALTGSVPAAESPAEPPPRAHPESNGSQTAPKNHNGQLQPQHRQNGNGHPLAPQAPVQPETLISAWITVTDDRWIASLTEMIARQQLIAELPLTPLLEQLGQPQRPLDDWLSQVITAACTATERATADSGLRQQNFFQQAVYLEDLLPQLLWYAYRASSVIAQLIDGVPARFLAPDRLWQTGRIRLLTTLQLRTQQRKMMVDLATATPLPFPVQRLPRDGVIQSTSLPLLQQPYTVAQLETRLYRLLRQATPELDWLLRGTLLELHLLEPVNEPERQTGAMQLGLGLQFTPDPTTVTGTIIE